MPDTPNVLPCDREAAFWARVDRRGADECWPWLGAKSLQGYGQFSAGGKLKRAHRFSYTIAKGDIPDGLVLDHLCRNRGCVNPHHLQAVTNKTNVLRGVGLTAQNAVKTHCKRGHLLTPDNLKRRKHGWRECATCASTVLKTNRNVARKLARQNGQAHG